MEKDCAPEKAYFILELAQDLARITRGHERLATLKYLLEMVMVEAQDVVDDDLRNASHNRYQSAS